MISPNRKNAASTFTSPLEKSKEPIDISGITRSVFISLILVLSVTCATFAGSLQRVAKKLSASAGQLKNKQVAVLSFPYHDGGESAGSTIVAERLITQIMRQKKLKVVERSLLDKVMGELKMQHSGAISQESAKKLGSVLGVEAIVTGTLIDLGPKSVEVNARVIETETGLVLAAESVAIKKEWDDDSASAKAGRSMEPEAVSAEPDPQKMSVFFHSREISQGEDRRPAPRPRTMVHPSETDGDYAPDGEGPQNIEPHGLKITNISRLDQGKDMTSASLLDSPIHFLSEIQTSPEEETTPEWARLQQTWKRSFPENKFDQAVTDFKALNEEWMGSRKMRYAALARLYLADAYFQQGQFDAAIREARPIAQKQDFRKVRGYAIYILARCQEELGQFRVAEALYRQIVQNFPFEPKLISASGHRMRYRGRS